MPATRNDHTSPATLPLHPSFYCPDLKSSRRGRWLAEYTARIKIVNQIQPSTNEKRRARQNKNKNQAPEALDHRK